MVKAFDVDLFKSILEKSIHIPCHIFPNMMEHIIVSLYVYKLLYLMTTVNKIRAGVKGTLTKSIPAPRIGARVSRSIYNFFVR